MRLESIRRKIKEAASLVFFGGAGTSTESGIPDFRTAGGLYSQPGVRHYTPEELLSRRMLEQNPELFFEYYRNHLLYPNAKPNRAHVVLSKWEREGRLDTVITQNIDGLHQMAGSQRVLELHGSVHRNYCTNCDYTAGLDEIMKAFHLVPQCPQCGGMLRPDVVLYGEALDSDVMHQAVQALQRADFLIVGGTSLVVYPAAGLIDYFQGENLLLINREATPYDHRAKWVIHDMIGEVLSQLSAEPSSNDH
ncbi:MAG: NAD-dependent protein deacylase [Bacillota bacterium]|nr:NAD-dependent protein deacylase [Bacillota bacterium]MDW7676179.1 NAD-dependent protein deacylase [Bacillota bacterium]